MKVLVIGSGGREHALAWKLMASDQVKQVYVAPGNAGTGMDFTNVAIDVMDFPSLAKFAQNQEIDLTLVGPEDPLSAGIVDYFQERNLKIFGPNQACAQFEASKDFTKQFLNQYAIPTAHSLTTSDYEEALAYLETQDFPIVIKADGLYKGKGVVICQDLPHAKKTLDAMLIKGDFGSAGSVVVIEEYLSGTEQSLLCLVSDNRLIPMETACDYKKALDGDRGGNTGGVGVYSPGPPASLILNDHIEEILNKIQWGLDTEGFHFYGILFIGFMIENDQAKVLEFNVRFGDPETEALMPRLQSDLFTILNKTLSGDLQRHDLIWSNQSTVGVVMYSQGYPENYENNVPISHLPELEDQTKVIFHNGTSQVGEQLVTKGGRVLTPVAMADSLEEARIEVYHLVEQIKGDSLIYRSDIGKIQN